MSKQSIIVASGIALMVIIGGAVWYHEAQQTPSSFSLSGNQASAGNQTAQENNVQFGNQNSANASANGSSPQAKTTPSSNSNTALPKYSTTYSTSSQISWHESESQIFLTEATLAGNTLSLNLTVNIGNNGACIPLNLRINLDENQEASTIAPTADQFPFENNGDCRKLPDVTYTNQIVSFLVGSSTFPLTLSTGGAQNIYFTVATTTAGNMQITAK